MGKLSRIALTLTDAANVEKVLSGMLALAVSRPKEGEGVITVTGIRRLDTLLSACLLASNW